MTRRINLNYKNKVKKITRLAILLFLLSFTVYAFFQFPGFQGYEDETYNRIVKNLETGEFKTARSGYAQTLLETPFVIKGQIVDNFLGIQHAKTAQLCALFYNPFITALSVSVMFLIFALYAGRKKAFLLSLVYAFGTMAFPYASIGMEPTAVLFILLSVYFLFRSGRNIARYVPTNADAYLILSGLFYFLLFFSKAYYFVTLPAFLAYILLLSYRPLRPRQGGTTPSERSPIRAGSPQSRGEKTQLFSPSDEGEIKEGVDINKFIKSCLLFAAPLILILPVYLLANNYNFGAYFGGQYNLANELAGGERILFGIYGLLLSFGKSLFIYVPALILSVILFKRFYNRYHKEALFVILYSLLLILFVSQIHWWSDETWGPRYLLSLSAIGLLPLVTIAKEDFTSKAKNILITSLITLGFLFQLLGSLVRYDVFPYTFYDIYRATGYNVLASQEYQYIPQFAPYFVNFNYIKNRITGRNEPLYYKIIYTPPMEQVGGQGVNLTKELAYDTSKYRNHALNFWWMNVPNVSPYTLLGIFILILAGLGWWGKSLIESTKKQSTK